jgi:hypothetical protein
VVEVALRGLEPQRVEPHLLARRPKGRHGERLGLAAREHGGAVGARGDSDLDVDGPDLVGATPVRSLLVDRDAAPDDLLLEAVEGEPDRRAALDVVLGLRVAGQGEDGVGLHGARRVLALELVGHLGGRVELRAEPLAELDRQLGVDLRRRDLHLGLARALLELALRGAELLDLAVGDVEGVEDLRLGDLVGSGLDHEDGVLGAGHHEVEGGLEQVLLVRVHHEAEVAVVADAHGADGRGEGDVGHHQGRAGAVHGEDVVGVDVVDRHRDADDLRLPVPPLGKQRPQRAVDHARGQRALLPGAALALEE